MLYLVKSFLKLMVMAIALFKILFALPDSSIGLTQKLPKSLIYRTANNAENS
ncbi:hypothetical protein JYQ62_18580 [Nostoc sp. UHCC 0702]|nr:hypothetical protein JYQ62_18580 [Nostoc sp. UHCC 0702]